MALIPNRQTQVLGKAQAQQKEEDQHMKRFNLERTEDASGVSGTGNVAQGVEFDDGTVAMRWLTATASTALYASMEDVVTIHGHEGRTVPVFLDD